MCFKIKAKLLNRQLELYCSKNYESWWVCYFMHILALVKSWVLMLGYFSSYHVVMFY
jgi:hypothetical protein